MLKVQIKTFRDFLENNIDAVTLEDKAFGYYSYDAPKFLYNHDEDMLLIDEPIKMLHLMNNNKHGVVETLSRWLNIGHNIQGIFLRPVDDREIGFRTVYTNGAEIVGAIVYSETSGTWGSHT